MTTGRYKRMMKRAINPFYGRKGVGFLKNPSKAIRGMVYRRTTIGTAPSDISRILSKKRKATKKSIDDKTVKNKLQKGVLATFVDAHKENKRSSQEEKIKIEQEKNIARDNMNTKYHLPSNSKENISNEKPEKNSYISNTESSNAILKTKNAGSNKDRRNILFISIGCLLLIVVFALSVGSGSNNTSLPNNGYDNKETTNTYAAPSTTDKNYTSDNQPEATEEPSETIVESQEDKNDNFIGQYTDGRDIWTFNADNTATYTGNKDIPYTIIQGNNKFNYTAKSYYMTWILDFSEDWSTLEATNDFNGSVIKFQRV